MNTQKALKIILIFIGLLIIITSGIFILKKLNYINFIKVRNFFCQPKYIKKIYQPDIVARPVIIYLKDGALWILDIDKKRKWTLLDLKAYDIQDFDVSEDGEKVVYILEKGQYSEIYEMKKIDTGQLSSNIFPLSNIKYESVKYSPDSSKIAYVKKVYDEEKEIFSSQQIWMTDLQNQTSTPVVSTQYDFSEMENLFNQDDPCSFKLEDSLIYLDQWLTNDHIAYRDVYNYECGGPFASFLKIVNTQGVEDSFSKKLSREDYFFAFNNPYLWKTNNIILPANSENRTYLLEQNALMPLTNERVVIIENEEIKSIIAETNYENTQKEQGIQHVRGNFDFNGSYAVWSEWLNFLPSVYYQRNRTSSKMWIADTEGNKKQLTDSEEYDDLNPVLLKDNRIVFERRIIDDKKNPPFYPEQAKELYIINPDGSGLEKIATEQITNKIVSYQKIRDPLDRNPHFFSTALKDICSTENRQAFLLKLLEWFNSFLQLYKFH